MSRLTIRGLPGHFRRAALVAAPCLALAAAANAGVPNYSVVILDNPAPQANAAFGRSGIGVSDLNGDNRPDLLVGARYQDAGGNTDQGRVYVFSGANGEVLWTLEDPGVDEGASFGRDIDPIGDIDDDGVTDILVGAPFEDVGDIFQGGRAYVFSGATGDVLMALEDAEAHTRSHFALTVSRLGDVNNDAVPDMFIGEHFQTVDGRPNQGRAFVYSGATGEIIHLIDHPTPQRAAIFADEVVGLGDVNGDQVPDLLTGAFGQDVAGKRAQGRAFVISGATGSVIHQVEHPAGQANAIFGDAVAAIGDVDGDDVADFVVGARFQDVGGGGVNPAPSEDVSTGALPPDGSAMPQVFAQVGTSMHCIPDLIEGSRVPGMPNAFADQGQAYVFSGATGALVHVLNNPVPQAGAAFGSFLESTPDIDGDGVDDVLVGAPLEDVNGNTNQGQAFVFSGASGELLLTFNNPTPQAYSWFGFPVAPAGDLNRDGQPDFYIGASGQDVNGNQQQGRGFVFLSQN